MFIKTKANVDIFLYVKQEKGQSYQKKKYEEIWIQNNVKFLCGKNKWKGNWWTMKA